MKKLFAVILTVLLTISCSSSDSDSASPADNDNILLRKIISTSSLNPGNTYTNTYTYNGKKLANINVGDNTDFRYYYTGDLITTVKDYFQGTLQGTATFQYDGSRRLILWTEYVDAPETRINRQIEFHYNDDNTITVNGQIFDVGEKQLYPINTQRFFLNANDEVERVEVLFPNGTQVVRYTYDNKNNAFKNITGFREINKLFLGGFNANITSILYSGYDSGYNDLSAEVRTYTYDTNDFPVAGVRSRPNDATMSTMTDEYIY